jgi:hypothetical protein
VAALASAGVLVERGALHTAQFVLTAPPAGQPLRYALRALWPGEASWPATALSSVELAPKPCGAATTLTVMP